MTLEDLKTEVNRLAQIIKAPDSFLPTFANTKYDGTPNLEVLDQGFIHFIVTERNEEYERRITRDLSKALFWIFEYVTFSMASDFEQKNRIEGQDFRILLFEKQDELLERLDSNWAEITRKKHKKLLSPTEEIKRNRKEYCEKLEKEGIDLTTAWNIACEKYPTE